jgi:sucrose-6-phosphate hydrolase SacC (GH32 family)
MVFYKPQDGWAGDFIPFHWNGEYHLFYLKDRRDEDRFGRGMPWYHVGTRDFRSYSDYGEALPHLPHLLHRTQSIGQRQAQPGDHARHLR